MKISEPTLQALEKIITGNGGMSPRQSGPQLVNFFNRFGCNDEYGKGFPSRWQYAQDNIRNFNGTSVLKAIILATVDPRDYLLNFSIENATEYLNEFLVFDNYKLVKNEKNRSYSIQILETHVIELKDNLDRLSHDFISDQIRKANDKLTTGDYDGAITNARSLVEAIQEELIKRACILVPEYGGDLVKLYKITKKCLKLDPDQKDLTDTLKQILSGLNSVVNGLSGLSNKMGDRHSRTYQPREHHAKLAVNAAFTLCEFLLDTFEHQQALTKPSGPSTI